MTNALATSDTPATKTELDLLGHARAIGALQSFAETAAESDLVPKEYRGKPGNCLVAMQYGAELGMGPVRAMQSICVINGRPSLFGDAMLALVKASPLFAGIVECLDGQGEAMLAKCTVHRHSDATVTRTFSVSDAKRARLWGKAGPWTEYPWRMLQMRARAFALRDLFPDVLAGVACVEEQLDIPQPTVTAATESPKTLADLTTHLTASTDAKTAPRTGAGTEADGSDGADTEAAQDGTEAALDSPVDEPKDTAADAERLEERAVDAATGELFGPQHPGPRRIAEKIRKMKTARPLECLIQAIKDDPTTDERHRAALLEIAQERFDWITSQSTAKQNAPKQKTLPR